MTSYADLATVPEEVRREQGPSPRGRGLLDGARRAWRRLTSMRTALILLFLLAVAAVPGSYFPQRTLNPGAVAREFAETPNRARIRDALGLYDVYGAWWFVAVYALLFVSLVGCLAPRIRLHTRALRARPPAPPRVLDRLSSTRTAVLPASADDVAAAAQKLLRRRRWRTEVRRADDGTVSVAAEKGYTRETGNLVFHVALVALLAGIAAGSAYGFKGTALIVEGDTFTSTPVAYDTLSPGRLFDARDMHPFTVSVDDFEARYLPNGTPEDFVADVRWRGDLDGAERAQRLRVNHPLTIGGDRVYLLSHGYALRFTVRAKDGTLLYDQWTPFLPQDPTLLSVGVVKVPDVAPGMPQIGVRGVFLPTLGVTPEGVVYSRFPDDQLPVFSFEAWAGDLGLDSGVPQNVYELDTAKLVQTGRATLLPGQEYTHLAGGATIRFEGVRDYAVVQVTRDPGKYVVLAASIAALAGLVLSLRVRRRRLWVRAAPAGAGTLVTVAGLARQDPDAFADEFATLADALGVPAPPPTPDSDPDPDPLVHETKE